MNYLIQTKSKFMNIENTKAQMRKGFSSFASYLYEKDAYTSEILDTLKNAKLLVVEEPFILY
jgi:PadR family transcriptional regulator PadR